MSPISHHGDPIHGRGGASPSSRRVKGRWIRTQARRKGNCPVCKETIELEATIAKFIPQGRTWRHEECIGKTAPDQPWSTSGTSPEPITERLEERVDDHTFSGWCDICGVQLWNGEIGKCRSCRRSIHSKRWDKPERTSIHCDAAGCNRRAFVLDGWVSIEEGGDWFHFCPDHATEDEW